jgi:hypothetical protein
MLFYVIQTHIEISTSQISQDCDKARKIKSKKLYYFHRDWTKMISLKVMALE